MQAARLVEAGRIDQRHGQVHQRLAQRAAVAQDQQVDRQAVAAPIAVRLQQLARQAGVKALAQLEQQQRQVARHAIRLQVGLRAYIARDDGGIGAQRGNRLQQATGQAVDQLGIGLLDVIAPQVGLGPGPGGLDRVVDLVACAIARRQLTRQRTAGSGAQQQVDRDLLLRSDGDGAAQGQQRLIRLRVRPRQRAALAHRAWQVRLVAAPDETCTAGLRACWSRRIAHRHAVHDDGRAGRGHAQQAVGGRIELDPDVAASALLQGRSGQRHAAGQLQGTCFRRAVDDANAAQLDVVARRHHRIGAQLDAVVHPAQAGPSFGQHRLAFGWPRAAGQQHIGPGGAAGGVAHMAGQADFARTGARQQRVFPAADGGAGIVQHQMVAAIRQQLDFGQRRGIRCQHARIRAGRGGAVRRPSGAIAQRRLGAGCRRGFLQQAERGA